MTESSQAKSDQSARDRLKALADAHGWKLDVWPANRMEPQGEVWLKLPNARIVVKGREAEPMCADMLADLAEIARSFDETSVAGAETAVEITGRSWDPEAAGRRAVEKHRDALKRLSAATRETNAPKEI